MGRKRFNHQIYTDASLRVQTAQSLSTTLTKIRAEYEAGFISEHFCIEEALRHMFTAFSIETSGPRICRINRPIYRHRWKGIPERAIQALECWATGEWALQLSFRDIPPLEILRLVAEGRRVVSLLTRPEELASLVENKFDALGFIIHDLMHAYQFFHDQESKHGQSLFAHTLLRWMEECENNPAFQDVSARGDFSYLISDMNSHPKHLWLTLKYILEHSGCPELWDRFVALAPLKLAAITNPERPHGKLTQNGSPSEMITNDI